MAGPSDVDVNNCFGRLSNYYQQNLSGINELKKEIEKLKAEGTEATDKVNQWLSDLELLDSQAAAIIEDLTTRHSVPFLIDNIKIGPWGGLGAYSSDIGRPGTQITRVGLHTGDVVDSLEISYVDDRNEVKTYKAGGSGGELHEFELERGEYINGMFGSFNDYYGEVCITELGFKTNLGNDHGPFGGGGGEGFSVPVVAGRIVGFFGEYDRYINSIGVSLALN
ncbi:jacalin-related lectin 3-like [Zingiber officinale]|uniref:Jacalin-type lectin domain-containing protein n=1 Tax=Zingiber officinale TaxID=94328 RepID=A0A8J5HPU7_ZINOF|nr:jacalin-related lectin 3-like [Zingiber officinale]KAG6530549.1 hypothetical protein ZIOFF_012790 [Zingiber officinale]